MAGVGNLGASVGVDGGAVPSSDTSAGSNGSSWSGAASGGGGGGGDGDRGGGGGSGDGGDDGAVRGAVDVLEDVDQLVVVIVRHIPEHDSTDTSLLGMVDLDGQGLDIIVGDEGVGSSAVQPGGLGDIVPVAGPAGGGGGDTSGQDGATDLLPLPHARVDGSFVTEEVDVVAISWASLRGDVGLVDVHGDGVLGVHVDGGGDRATIEGSTDNNLAEGEAGVLPGINTLGERELISLTDGSVVERSVRAGGGAPASHDIVRHDGNPVKVGGKGSDIGHGLAIGAIEGLDADSSGQELAVVRELQVQLGTELTEENKIVGRVVGRHGVADSTTTAGVLPVEIDTVHVPAIGLGSPVGEGVVADKDHGVVDEGLAETGIGRNGREGLGTGPASDGDQNWDTILVTALDESLDVVSVVVAVKVDVSDLGVALGSDTETAVKSGECVRVG